MITPLNRVKLFVDASSEAAANVWNRLKTEGIDYVMTTRQTRGALSKALTSGRGVGQYMGGMSASSFSDRLGYVYTIYVRRKDEARAREICGLTKAD